MPSITSIVFQGHITGIETLGNKIHTVSTGIRIIRELRIIVQGMLLSILNSFVIAIHLNKHMISSITI